MRHQKFTFPRASGPVLTSLFLFVPDHSALARPFTRLFAPLTHSRTPCRAYLFARSLSHSRGLWKEVFTYAIRRFHAFSTQCALCSLLLFHLLLCWYPATGAQGSSACRKCSGGEKAQDDGWDRTSGMEDGTMTYQFGHQRFLS